MASCKGFLFFVGRCIVAALLAWQGYQMFNNVQFEDIYRYHFIRFNHYILGDAAPFLLDWYSIIYFWMAFAFVLAALLFPCNSKFGAFVAFSVVIAYSLIMENPAALGRPLKPDEKNTFMINLAKSGALALASLVVLSR